MAVQVPYNINEIGKAQNRALFTCSVDARWAMGHNVGAGLPNTDNMVTHGELKSTRPPTTNLSASPDSFLPIQGPDWQTVKLDLDWLNVLTPPMGRKASTGWTTLAESFTYAGFDNSTGLVDGSWAALGSTIESTIATTVVDGMSRIGLSANGGNMTTVFDRYLWLRFLPERLTDSARYFSRILDGETVVEAPEGVPLDKLAKMTWKVTVSGLAFGADGIPYYLALGVLCFHATLAGLQTVHMLWTRRSSESWDSFEEILLLSQQSRPSKSEKLKNTSAGIWYGRTYQCTARIAIRDDKDRTRDEEMIQLILDPDDEDTRNLSLIEDNVKYGVRRRVNHG